MKVIFWMKKGHLINTTFLINLYRRANMITDEQADAASATGL